MEHMGISKIRRWNYIVVWDLWSLCRENLCAVKPRDKNLPSNTARNELWYLYDIKMLIETQSDQWGEWAKTHQWHILIVNAISLSVPAEPKQTNDAESSLSYATRCNLTRPLTYRERKRSRLNWKRSDESDHLSDACWHFLLFQRHKKYFDSSDSERHRNITLYERWWLLVLQNVIAFFIAFYSEFSRTHLQSNHSVFLESNDNCVSMICRYPSPALKKPSFSKCTGN